MSQEERAEREEGAEREERRSPFRDFEEMIERMGERLEQFREREFSHERPAVDVSETDGEFTVTADIPGFEEADIDLRIRDNTLRIRAAREEEAEPEEEEEGRYLRRERRRRAFTRTIPLPEPVEEAEATATVENGVLTVTLPKTEEGEESGYTIPLSE